MPPLYPLRFHPLFRQYLWGGRKLATSLGKPIGSGNDCAESWEICDHGDDQSIVAFGPLTGATLGQLVAQRGSELLGFNQQAPRFPLLMKFLDATQTLSVQVHPDDAKAAKLTPPDLGKTEAWVVLEALPGSKIYAGLKPNVDRETLASAIREGYCQDCLHVFQPSPGDCVFLPAGTVHALGAGLLVAEIQQAEGLDAVDFLRGPVQPQQVRPTEQPQIRRLVECEYFVLDRWEFDCPLSAGGDGRCHIISVLEGAVQVEGDPSNTALCRGGTIVLPAALGPVRLSPLEKAVLLDAKTTRSKTEDRSGQSTAL
jgi:mannose-6-phosphate isomerase